MDKRYSFFFLVPLRLLFYNNHYAPVSANKCSLLFSDHTTRIIGQVYHYVIHSYHSQRTTSPTKMSTNYVKKKVDAITHYIEKNGFFYSLFSLFLIFQFFSRLKSTKTSSHPFPFPLETYPVSLAYCTHLDGMNKRINK